MANFRAFPKFFRSGFTPPHWCVAIQRKGFWNCFLKGDRRLIEFPPELAKELEAFYEKALKDEVVQLRQRNPKWGRLEIKDSLSK